jgi:Golgi apparatus protein 1
MRASSKRQLFAMVVLLSFAIAPWAIAQTTGVRQLEDKLDAAAEAIQSACGADVKTYCGKVTPGEGRMLFCVLAHEDKVSTKCDYTLYSASRNLDRALDRIEQVADACWDDIERHCSDTAAGGGQIAQCLVAKKSSLAKECSDVVTKFGQ